MRDGRGVEGWRVECHVDEIGKEGGEECGGGWCDHGEELELLLEAVLRGEGGLMYLLAVVML